MKTPRLLLFGFAIFLLHHSATAQCTQLATGLLEPLGSALSSEGNLLVAESGTGAPHSGRISIIDPRGYRRTLIDGLPSGIDDVGGPSGPSGIYTHGRTLYVTIGSGDAGQQGPAPGTDVPNPNGPSSPLFSSVLEIRFSADLEKRTTGVVLAPTQEQALANGETVWLTTDRHERISIRMLANFPDYIPFPLPNFPQNVQLSNPYHLVAGDDMLYVTDGGRNLVWQVNPRTGSYLSLVSFPNIPNPLFGVPGLPPKPTLDPVPTGIDFERGKLLVTLFRGAPFPSGTSTVEQIDPASGTDTRLISGLTSPDDIIASGEGRRGSYLVLQFASQGPFLGGPGLLLRFDPPTAAPIVLADCLTAATSMTLDARRGVVYVTEEEGRVVRIAFRQNGGRD